MKKNAMRIVTLRIKKKYLDLIRSGEKVHEYRSASAYYVRLFQGWSDKKPFLLCLHYQNPNDKLLIKVVKVEHVMITEAQRATGIFTTESVFKLTLEKLPRVIFETHNDHGFLSC